MTRYECTGCGWVYDPAEGDADSGVEAGTLFHSLPHNWDCPHCGAAKAEFEPEA